MPQRTDYTKGVIYQLSCLNPAITDNYIGSTTNFIQRKRQYKSDALNEACARYNNKLYKCIRENGGWINWTMTMIEDVPCTSKRELEKRERYHFEQLKPSLNGNHPSTSQTECKMQYYE